MFNYTSFHLLGDRDAASEGRKGGRSKSLAKQKAARENGAHGGRARTRTLGEFLLRQKFDSSEQYDALREAFFRLRDRERKALKEYFGISPQYPELNITDFVLHKRKPGAEMQHIIKKFRLEARWLLSNLRPVRIKPPKDYVVIRVLRSEGAREAWERRHPHMPFVATYPKKIYFEQMVSFKHLDQLVSLNPNRQFSVEAVQDTAQSDRVALSEDHAEAFLKYLAFKHKQPS